MRKNLSISLLALTFALTSTSTVPTAFAQQKFDVEKAISSGDHKGLAEYYKAQAEEQRKIAAMHDKMKVAYRQTHVHYKGIENDLAGHCGDLKFEALKMAEQYDKLAAQEEKLAAPK